MKSCPECNRTFSDETLSFCLVDGAILSAPYDPKATLIIPEARQTEPPPTEVLKLDETKQEIPPTIASPQSGREPEELVSTITAPAPILESSQVKSSSAQPTGKPNHSLLIMASIGALLIIGLIFIITANRTGKPTENTNIANAATTPAVQPTVAASPNSNRISNVAATPTPMPTPVANLEGTTWRVRSTIGSTDYEDQTLEFKNNGRIIHHINTMEDGNWRYNNRGKWIRQGDKVFIDFPTNPYYEHYKYEGTIQGEEMKGIIDLLGRESNGIFTARPIK